MDEELLPRDLIGAVVSKVGTAKQLCTILQLCKSWRAALTGQEPWKQSGSAGCAGSILAQLLSWT